MVKKVTSWSKTEEALLKKLRRDHTLVEIQRKFKENKFNRSRKALERKCANMGLSYEGKSKTSKNVKEAKRKEAEYLKTWNNIVNIKFEYKTDITTRTRGLPSSKTKRRKILSLSDAHIPFDRDDLIHEAIRDHKDADILVINGDLLDLHAVSTWPKEKAIVLRKEYDIAMEYMKLFSDTFPQVVMIRGNHEFRLNRYFNSNVDQSVSFMVNKEILGRIANGEVYDDKGNITKKHDFKNVYYTAGQEAWFYQIGKTMFLHPQSFSKINAKTSIMAWEYFMDREDIDAVVVSHTHQQSKVYNRGRLCIEQGCLCVPLDYAKQGKLSYGPQTLGYAVIYQDEEGNTDFNMTHLVFKGIQYPVKKNFDELKMEEKQ